jgi:hypothetical protein
MKLQVMFDIADFCELVGIFKSRGILPEYFVAKNVWQHATSPNELEYLNEDTVQYILLKHTQTGKIETTKAFREYINICKKSMED